MSRTILLADDDAAVLGLCAAVLRAAGFCVLQAQGPIEAIRTADEHPDAIDLLVTDLEMPHMNGLELVSALRLAARRPGIRVLIISGGAERSGDYPLLKKPFTSDQLLRAVRSALTG